MAQASSELRLARAFLSRLKAVSAANAAGRGYTCVEVETRAEMVPGVFLGGLFGAAIDIQHGFGTIFFYTP